MIKITSLADLELIRESVDLEFKLSVGKDGNGTLPQDFWPTYSAFANTEGGVIVLGVHERKHQFIVEGINDSDKARRELFDGLNNRQKISANLLSDTSVQDVLINGRTVLLIDVPRATRKQRPVYITTNPFAGHTFRRLNDGDRVAPDNDVKRMLAEQVEDRR
jgi:predicted HTH transcriptional regulator